MIIAMDPSINKTGFCVMAPDGAIVESGVFRTARDATVTQKQAILKDQLKAVLGRKEYHFRLCMVEIPAPNPFSRTQGKGGRIMNLDALLKLSRAVGVLTQTLHEWGVVTYEVTPAQWKGKRQKCWDQMTAQAITGRNVTNDESDAIALADYGRRIYGRMRP